MLSKSFVKALMVAPAVLGATVIASEAVAQEATSVDSLAQINEYSLEGQSSSLPQVTSVSQLSDVQPTDWAFQALQSLVERYGCIAGYPNGTYRGNRAMTRYEFAAGLNACLDRINELIAAGLADKVSREDLAVLQRLQEEFAAELATLRGRVDALEARVAELEDNQFSTTTKLGGEVIFANQIGIDEDNSLGGATEATFGYRVRLNLNTSFTGDDLLRTRLQARDINTVSSDTYGLSYGGSNGGDFTLDDLFYTFPVGSAQVLIGANSIGCDDYVASTISPLDSSSSGSTSDFGFPPQYGMGCTGTAGAGLLFQIADGISLDLGYSAEDASSPTAGEGLFNGDYGAIAQLTALDLFGVLDWAFTYVHGYDDGGFSDAPFTLASASVIANTYGSQANFKFDWLELGGGVSYTNYDGPGASPEEWSYQFTAAINDVGFEGSQVGILTGALPWDDAVEDQSWLTELYYKVQLTDNISITPAIVWIDSPGNDDSNDDSWVGNLRTTFSF
ncbi:MAG: iron uptake porin [Leptolyngbyaceae cyanobacterium]